MILPFFLVRPCELPVKKGHDHAISPAWYLERAVNASHGTSAGRPAESIGFHIFLVAAVAGCPQLPDQPSELIQAFGLGAESEEKREPVSDIHTGVADSLKVLDPGGRLEKRTCAVRSTRSYFDFGDDATVRLIWHLDFGCPRARFPKQLMLGRLQ